MKSEEMNINFALLSRDDEERTEIDPQANRMTGSKLVSRSFSVSTTFRYRQAYVMYAWNLRFLI